MGHSAWLTAPLNRQALNEHLADLWEDSGTDQPFEEWADEYLDRLMGEE